MFDRGFGARIIVAPQISIAVCEAFVPIKIG